MAIWNKKNEYALDTDENTDEYEEYYPQRRRGNKRLIRILPWIICLAAAIGLLAYACVFYADNWLQKGYIHNVSIGGVSLQGLTVEEATSLLAQHADALLPKNDLIVQIADQTLVLTYQDTKASLNVASIANYAYLHGRSNNRDGADPYELDPLDFVDIDPGSVRALLKAFIQPFNGVPTQTTATLIGERPDLTQEAIPGEANQILTITLGSSKYLCDPETLFSTLNNAHRTRTFVIVGETRLIEPEPPDASIIFHEHCVYPINASIDPETSIVTESAPGYGFNISEVQQLLDEAEEGEVITIPLKRLEPSITTDMLLGTTPE